MPHEYRPPKKYPPKGKDRRHSGRPHEDRPKRPAPKSLGNEVTRKDSIHAKLQKQLFWCPKCNIPLLAKTCACDTESIRVDLQQPFDVRPALKADYDLILSTFRKRFGDRVTLPKILVLNKAGGLDRNDLIIANGIRFAWFSFNPTTRTFSVDIEAAALPYLAETADRSVIRLEDAAVSIPDGRLGGKRLDIRPQPFEDGMVIVRYKSKWGTGILKGTSLKIKELGALEERPVLPDPEWSEAVAKNAFHLKNMERTAVREIRQNLTLRPEINCSFSGGKDSTAVWNIAQKAGVTKAFFIDTGLEFPETVAFVKEQNVAYIEKAGNFWQAVERAGPPAKDHRWCCKLLKLNPVKIHLNESGPCLTVQGNRWYESWNRAELEAVTQNPNNPLQLNISPIRSWRALDVFFYLWLKEIPYNPLYEMGYERIGCYLCPAMLESELETMHHTHAEMAARWDEFLTRWAEERGLPPEYIGWGLWRWKEMPPKMKELVRDSGLDLTEHPVRRSTPASVASLMPEHQVGDIVDDTTPDVPVEETPKVPELPKLDIEKIRADFPMLGDYIYLDSGATSFSPNQVIAAATEYDTTFRANVGRGVHRLTRIATQKYWHAHQKVSEFINGSAGTLVFTKNSTEALNMVARGFAFRPGDAVVTTVLEHHSNILPWRELQKNGVGVRMLDIDDSLALDLQALAHLLETEPVKMVTVCHVSNVTGTVNPIAEIARMCHAHGAKLCVDAAQSAPKMRIDVEELGCDYLAFSGHKMLGPSGTGALWMRDADLAPLIVGGGMVERVSDTDYVPAKGYQRYEAGSPNISGGIGFGAAVDYLSEIGMDSIEARERRLTAKLIEELERIRGVTLYCAKNPAMRIGAVSFTLAGISAHEAAALLDEEYGIAVRSGMHCTEPLMRRLGAPEGTIRATPAFYTTETEVNMLAAAVREIMEKL
ncbi:MAG TPA: aminotransferase class V-fold PLP-dependent enzyme [Methanocorpusculum sp.]|nr:aminotransferase class V-fold PLP-dependent enzyme [Methanocorpusculum sp.]